MGRDKARLPLGSRTMLGQVRATVAAVPLKPRVIRKDAVARCGPLGGIVTAFLRTRAPAALFLACDMPLVTPEYLRRLVRASGNGTRAAFSVCDHRPGFPFILPRSALKRVEEQRRAGDYSLRSLAKRLRATELRMPRREAMNINDPAELATLRTKL